MTPATAEAAAPVTISLTDASARATAALVAKHGEAQRAAIESGVARVASRWSAADGASLDTDLARIVDLMGDTEIDVRSINGKPVAVPAAAPAAASPSSGKPR